jgi:hypothetical protein
MFLIANVTSEIYTIGDLNITLNGGEATDLDARRLKIHPDQSKDLKTLLRSGKIQIIRRDYIEKKPDITPVPKKELMSEIQEMLRTEIRNHLKNIQPQAKSSEGNNSDVLQAIQSLADILKTNGGAVDNSKQDENADDGIDPQVLVKLHEKAVEKQRKNMEGQVTTEKQTVKDSDIKDRASELDNLMGD